MIIFLILISTLAGIGFGFLLGKILERNTLQSKIYELEKNQVITETTKSHLEEQLDSYKKMIDEFKIQMKTEFENIGSKIFLTSTEKFKSESESSLKNILNPLKENIDSFKNKVEQTYKEELTTMSGLKGQITILVEQNQKMTEQTDSLTRALKGDQKVQGSWGEITLERILESSGLRKGEEFTVQGKELGLKDIDGKVQKPDVIVNLPENKHLIIDSKVSLRPYQILMDAKTDLEREASSKLFINSIYAHIDDLSRKDYQDIDKLGTPDFVFLFIPMEGAFSLAVQIDKELFAYAWKKNIVIVCPSTLLATLRTVASMWKIEMQNKNALEIAKQSGLLYEKFKGLYEDLELIGSILKKAQETHYDAMNKLASGKGNLLSRVERLKKLGAKTEKNLPITSSDYEELEEIQNQ